VSLKRLLIQLFRCSAQQCTHHAPLNHGICTPLKLALPNVLMFLSSGGQPGTDAEGEYAPLSPHPVVLEWASRAPVRRRVQSLPISSPCVCRCRFWVCRCLSLAIKHFYTCLSHLTHVPRRTIPGEALYPTLRPHTPGIYHTRHGTS